MQRPRADIGREPTALAKADEALPLLKPGTGATEVVWQLGIDGASVFRIIEAATAE